MGEAKRKIERLRPELRQLVPERMRGLPVDERGFPVPWFVVWLDEARTTELAPGKGKPDFRIIGRDRVWRAVRGDLCWVCGNPLGRPPVACVIGPMCAVNRISSEPPSHVACARFAAKACPFLTRPRMRRNERGLEAMPLNAPGTPIDRNPGLALLWLTKRVTYGVSSRLFDVGEPLGVEWYCEGRAATRGEVLASFNSGLPALWSACDEEPDAEVEAAAREELQRRICSALELVPAEAEAAA